MDPFEFNTISNLDAYQQRLIKTLNKLLQHELIIKKTKNKILSVKLYIFLF